MQSLSKFKQYLFEEIEKKKKSWIPCLEGLQIDKRILKKNKVEGLTWSDHKTYLESTVLKKDCGIGIKEDI